LLLDSEKSTLHRKSTHFDESSLQDFVKPSGEISSDLDRIAEEFTDVTVKKSIVPPFMGKTSLSARAETMSRFRVLAEEGDIDAQFKLGIL
jgi:hypothetical protein